MTKKHKHQHARHLGSDVKVDKCKIPNSLYEAELAELPNRTCQAAGMGQEQRAQGGRVVRRP